MCRSRLDDDRAFGARLFDIVNRIRRHATRVRRPVGLSRGGEESVSVILRCLRHRATVALRASPFDCE
jgi:hypothetical protein